MRARLDIEVTPDKKLVADAQTRIGAAHILFGSGTCVGDFEGVEFEVGIYFKVFPDIITQENSGRRSVLTLESRQ